MGGFTCCIFLGKSEKCCREKWNEEGIGGILEAIILGMKVQSQQNKTNNFKR